jgi:Fuc2NAc and GlcNAc transferase
MTVGWLAAGIPGPLGMVGLAATLWWTFWAVASINVTNFIDGIDGIIGLQVLVFGLHVARLGQGQGGSAVLGMALAGVAAGFLAWNWAPARIFLGDVGSGALGFLMVVAGVQAMRATGASVFVVFLPLLPIFLDGTVTLLARWRRGDRLTVAHRGHLYQRLAVRVRGHAPVALGYGVASAAGLAAAAAPPGSQPVALLAYAAANGLAYMAATRWLERARTPG